MGGFFLQNVSQLLISVILGDGGFHFSVLPKQSADLQLLDSCHCTQTNHFLQTVLSFFFCDYSETSVLQHCSSGKGVQVLNKTQLTRA